MIEICEDFCHWVEHVPTWEEVLDLVQGTVGLNVHLKEGGQPDGHYARKVAKALHDF